MSSHPLSNPYKGWSHLRRINCFANMRTFTVVCFLAVVATACAGRQLHPLSDEFIAEINSKQSTWKAGRNFDINEYGLFKKLASGSKGIKNRQRLATRLHEEDVEIPESFDSREAWPKCADIIGMIRDQSRCGGCWALAAAEAMSDRICIHSNGQRKILVSAQDVLTCTKETWGCHGGYVDTAWDTWYTDGYVTGGLYNNTDQGCKSYFLPNCEDHPNRCTDYVDTPACVQECDDKSLNYKSQKTYGQEPFAFWHEKHIKLEILKNGPVETGFTVYADFASYKSGIYQHVSGDSEGGHAVKIIGWGVENGVKYWTIANSWNQRWGENGFFRILRGVNECGIEDEVISGLPDFSKF